MVNVKLSSIKRGFGISEDSYIERILDDKDTRSIVPNSLREVFGVDGEKAIEVARIISSSRRFEAEKEIRS